MDEGTVEAGLMRRERLCTGLGMPAACGVLSRLWALGLTLSPLITLPVSTPSASDRDLLPLALPPDPSGDRTMPSCLTQQKMQYVRTYLTQPRTVRRSAGQPRACDKELCTSQGDGADMGHEEHHGCAPAKAMVST